MDIERERFETETDLENLLFDKTVEFRKSLREPVSVKRFPYGCGKEVPFLLADGCYAALARLPVKRLKDARRLIRLLAAQAYGERCRYRWLWQRYWWERENLEEERLDMEEQQRMADSLGL